MSFKNNKVIQFFCKPWVLFLAMATLYLSPYLIYPTFNLIDDGYSMEVASRLQHDYSFHTWKSYLYEVQFGRLRSMYYVYYFFMHLLFGDAPIVYWLGQTALLTITLTLFYLLTKKVIGKTLPALFCTPLLLLLPSLMENFYRLGPAEPRQVIFIFLFFLWLFHFISAKVSVKQILLGAFLLLCAFFSKETSLVLFPVFCWIAVAQFLLGKWRKKVYIVVVGLFLFLSIGFYKAIPPSTQYSSHYTINADAIMHNLYVLRASRPELFVFWFAAVLATGLRLLLSKKHHTFSELLAQNFWLIGIGLFVAGNIALQLPWPYQLERYYYAADMFIVLYGCAELVLSVDFFKKHVKTLSLNDASAIVLTIFLFFASLEYIFLPSSIRIDWMIKKRTFAMMPVWFTQYQFSGPVTKFLLRNTPPNTTIYVNYDDYEVVYEIGLFASAFGQRPVKIISPNKQVVADFDSRYGYAADPIQSYQQSNDPRAMLLERGISKASSSASIRTELWPTPFFLSHDPKMVWSLSHLK